MSTQVKVKRVVLVDGQSAKLGPVHAKVLNALFDTVPMLPVERKYIVSLACGAERPRGLMVRYEIPEKLEVRFREGSPRQIAISARELAKVLAEARKA